MNQLETNNKAIIPNSSVMNDELNTILAIAIAEFKTDVAPYS